MIFAIFYPKWSASLHCFSIYIEQGIRARRVAAGTFDQSNMD